MSSLAYVAYIVFIILGIVKANNGENPELPVVGELAKSIFKNKLKDNLFFKIED